MNYKDYKNNKDIDFAIAVLEKELVKKRRFKTRSLVTCSNGVSM